MMGGRETYGEDAIELIVLGVGDRDGHGRWVACTIVPGDLVGGAVHPTRIIHTVSYESRVSLYMTTYQYLVDDGPLIEMPSKERTMDQLEC